MLGARYPQTAGTILLVLVFLITCTPIYAADLVDVYRLAQSHDPRFHAARNEYLAARQVLPQAKAAYKPHIRLQAQAGDTRQRILRSDNEVYGVGKSDFSTNTYNLEITQPIVNIPDLAWIREARAQVRQAEAGYAAARQEMLLRVAAAYLGALNASADARLAADEQRATARQLAIARKRLDTGLGTVTDVHEARARFELASARTVEARNALDDTMEAVRETAGVRITRLAPLRGELAPVRPKPPDVAYWIKVARVRNPTVAAQRQALRAAREEIRRRAGEHYPTLDLVGTHGRRDAGGSLFGGGSDVETTDVTLRLSVPLYAGGATSAETRAARYRYDKALDKLELQRRTARRQVRAAFFAVSGGVGKVAALRESVAAQQAALTAKEKGFEAGINSNLEVLDAQRDLYAAKRAYYQASYDYLLSILRLKQAAGTLGEADLVKINQVLAGKGTEAGLAEAPRGIPAAPVTVAAHSGPAA